MKIRSYKCPQCGREYNYANASGSKLCRACGCELDSLTVYSTDDGSTASEKTARPRSRKRFLCGRSTNPPHTRN